MNDSDTPVLLLRWPADPDPQDLRDAVESVFDEHVLARPCDEEGLELAQTLIGQVIESYAEARARSIARQLLRDASSTL